MQNNVDSSELNKKRGKRLRQAVLSVSETQKDFAYNIGNVTPTHLSAMICGTRNITEQFAGLVANAAGVRKEWLLCEDDFKTEAEKEEAEKREVLNPDGSAVTEFLFIKILERMVNHVAKDYGIQVTEIQQKLLYREVHHYTNYLIKEMMEETKKNGSDCEAKE